MKILVQTAAALIAVAGLSAAPARAHSAAEPTAARVRVESGVLQGAVENGVVAFKGIPYAAPPVGSLRWRPPQSVKAWSGVRQAVSYGPDCMQIPFPGDAAPLGVTPAEDCLYVNVWRPIDRGARKLPVMVWIYGGGFVNGGSSPPEYDGSAFARDGIVLVSFNYRLGNFGFFAHPALTAEQRGGALGNYAFMDQIALLKWVRRNIAHFGGDASNVTIFGESAGGMSVNALLTTPLAAGLFQKAIIESGGGRPNLLSGRPLSDGPNSAEASGLALAKRFGIVGEGPDALARLRAIPASTLVSGLNMATAGRDPTYVGGPILDGELDRGAPTQLYAKGEGARVPVMIGTNSMDIGFVQARTIDEFYAQFGPDAAQARKLYSLPAGAASSPAAALGALAFEAGGDQMMVEPARQIARLLSARGQPVYEYRFSYVAESLRSKMPGAPHATEIPYVFDTVRARYGQDLTAADEAAARAVHSYWVAFAKAGKPEPRGRPAWPAYTVATDQIMNFTDQGPVPEADRWKARLDVAQRVNDRKEAAPAANASVAQLRRAHVAQGELAGKNEGRVTAFLGVPFASPPVAANRWRPPQAPESWQGERTADRFAASCQQGVTPDGFGPWTAEYVVHGAVSEDCLYLNIWTPAHSSAQRLPVLFWIYGGGFSSGSGSVPIYDGAALAAKGIVVVSANYRVGVYGFLAHPALSAESPVHASGNYGLLDQLAALRWVHENIGSFGGDATKVTIAGQSAGAASVHHLIASPLANGLFARAIAESGSGMGLPVPDHASAEAEGVKLGKAGATELSLAQLRALSTAELDARVAKTSSSGTPGLRFGPAVDGWFLPSDAFVGKNTNDTPILTGMTANEMTGLSPAYGHATVESFNAQLSATYRGDSNEFEALYEPHSNANAWAATEALARDRGLAAMYFWARERLPVTKYPIYAYLWTHPEPGPNAERYAAFHSSEIPYVFETLDTSNRPFTAVDRALSKRISQYWINFVKTGDPNGQSLPQWPKLTESRKRILEIGERTGSRPILAPRELALFDHYVSSGGKLSLF